MAVSSSAMTLGQYALLSNDPLVQKVSFSLIDNGSVLDNIPLVTDKSMYAKGVRYQGSLPSVNWRALNTEPVVTSGTPTPFEEQAYIMSNAIDVDRYLVEDKNQIVDPRASQVEAYLKGAAYDINDKFINNNHSTGDANAFVGLRARIDNAAQFGVNSANKIDAGGVDLSLAGISAANANKFVEYVDQLLWSVGSVEGDGVVLYMNEVMKRRFATAVRQLGLGAGFDVTRDSFGRTVTTFRNAIVKDIGYKADQSTRIITNTETSAGANGASTMTSIYAVRYGTEYLFGWQFEPLVAKDIDMIGNAGTIKRMLIDWAFGLYANHTRCMARLYDIKMS